MGETGNPCVRPSRDILVDALRGIAIAAMLVAHAAPLLGKLPSVPAAAFDAINDVASPLFAMAMGMAGIIVLRRDDSRPGSFIAVKAVQGLFLILLGVSLAALPTWVGVVLPQLGILLIVGAPLLLLPARWLGWATAVAFLGGPMVVVLTGMLVPAGWVTNPASGPQLLQWLVTGSQYRLTGLLPFFLLGAFLYAAGALQRSRVLQWLAWGGAGIVLAGYQVGDFARASGAGYLVSSGGYLDLARDLGLTMLVTGIAGLAANSVSARARSLASRPVSFFAGPGNLALTLYAAHILVLIPVSYGMVEASRGARAGAFFAVVLGLLLAGWFWGRYLGKGPLEHLMTLLGSLVRRVTRKQPDHAL